MIVDPSTIKQEPHSIDTRSSKKRKLDETDLVPSQLLNTNPTKRKEYSVGQLIAYLERIRKEKHGEKQV